MFISYYNILLEVYFTHTQLHTETHLHTHTYTCTNYHYNFLLEFWNCACNTNFYVCFHHISDQTSVCSKRSWVDFSIVYSFYCWLFSLAPCRKISEYWSQAILSQTQNYEKNYGNYYQSCCICCLDFCLHSNIENFKQFSKENATKLLENSRINKGVARISKKHVNFMKDFNVDMSHWHRR